MPVGESKVVVIAQMLVGFEVAGLLVIRSDGSLSQAGVEAEDVPAVVVVDVVRRPTSVLFLWRED